MTAEAVRTAPRSHGTLYAGDRKTTVKDRKKEIGKGLLAKMLDDLGIDGDQEAFRQAGVSQRRLARDLDVAESEVRRMLNPDHATRSATIDRALRRLGKRVSVTVGEAA